MARSRVFQDVGDGECVAESGVFGHGGDGGGLV